MPYLWSIEVCKEHVFQDARGEQWLENPQLQWLITSCGANMGKCVGLQAGGDWCSLLCVSPALCDGWVEKPGCYAQQDHR